VTKAAIDYYYKRKEEILSDICDQALEFAYETTIVTDSSMGANERLERFVRGGVASITENMAVVAVLFQETSLRKDARAQDRQQAAQVRDRRPGDLRRWDQGRNLPFRSLTLDWHH
jgi:AcrR family transcriptional regulator